MIVDTSALLAVLFQEEDAADYARAISEAEICRMSAANYLEAGMNVDGQAGPDYGRKLDVFIRETKIILEPVTVEQAYVAREAFVNYGKGRHPARLNYGDCFAYALSKAMREPLLFKGKDFVQTDIEAVPLGNDERSQTEERDED